MNISKLFTVVLLSVSLTSITARAQEEDEIVSPSLWKGGYEKTRWEFVVGYVNQSWLCTYDTVSQREGFFGDTNDRFLNGIQMGALYAPSFDWGLGLRTGLLLEVYESRSQFVKEWCDKFSEGSFYIPLQGTFRFPITNDMAFSVFAGLGFQCAIQGRYENLVPTYARWRRPRRPKYETIATQEYGNGWPQRVNWQADCGFLYRFNVFAVGFTYSFGLNDHGIQNTFDDGVTYVTATRSRQDKIQASFIITL